MNDKLFSKRQWTREYHENGNKCRLTATARIESLSGQTPYFAITGDLWEMRGGRGRPRWAAGGCLHDDISKRLPRLAKFIKWHLMSTDKPMHYVANSLYWAGLQGRTDGKKDSPPNYNYLVDTSLWGVLPGDEKINLRWFMGRGSKKNIINRVKAYFLTRILEKRLEDLRAAFYVAMQELFPKEEVDAAFLFKGQ